MIVYGRNQAVDDEYDDGSASQSGTSHALSEPGV